MTYFPIIVELPRELPYSNTHANTVSSSIAGQGWDQSINSCYW